MPAQTAGMAYGSGTFLSVLISLASLVIVVVLILLSRHGLKFAQSYLQRSRKTQELALVESLMLDQRRRLSVVQCGARRGVILTGGGNDLFLGWMDEAQSLTTQPGTEGLNTKETVGQ
ncbi:flagellar biosynthetic protein FliO [Acetobacter malorum]|uniref:flagellar biosynthetic protein FliO n=1 Tax=Acetobacter malorum TaxID=178901 RepID=UPI000AA001B3|nr:flagellar biosynthetic protein FliO [Acetobacter malorum]